MRPLSHLALVLTVATLALLAPVAHANDMGGATGGYIHRLGGKIWQSDYGQTQFTYRATYNSPLFGDYDYYTGTLTYADGSAALLVAKYWFAYNGLVTFTYRTADDQGKGSLNY